MSKMMVREGGDTYEAWQVVQGMENAGAEVISVAYNGLHTREGAMIPCSKFTIWARVPDEIALDTVDHAIDKMLDS